jgi:hypothetical protein
VARIVEEQPYNCVRERVERLGLTPLLDELRGILRDFSLRVKEVRDTNGGAGRVPLDVEIRRAPFRSSGRRLTVARV